MSPEEWLSPLLPQPAEEEGRQQAAKTFQDALLSSGMSLSTCFPESHISSPLLDFASVPFCDLH